MPTVRAAEDTIHSDEEKYRNWDQYKQQRDQLDPFKDLLQRDPRVCDHCFILRYEELSLEWWRGTFGWLPYSRFVPIHPEERHEEFAPQDMTDGPRLACGNCGNRHTKQRPLCKEDVRSVAENISRTLTEKGIDHDEGVLMHTVERRNVSRNQGRQDSHVLSPAVLAAIESAHEDVARVVKRHLK